MRVYHLIKSFGRGGAETLLLSIFVARNNDQVQFRFGYFLPWKRQIADELLAAGAQVDCFKANGNLSILFKTFSIASILKNWNTDILHCHLPWAGLVGRLAGRISGIPVIYTEHNKQERYHWATRLINRITFSWQQCAIAVSREVAMSIEQNIRPKTPVHVVANGIDTRLFSRRDELRRASRSANGIEENELVVGLVAVFRKQKRLSLWLKVASLVKQRMDNVKFVLVGDGPCRTEVEEGIRLYSLSTSVQLPGLKHDPRPYYECFDLLLMTSIFEGLPVAVLEAMAMQVPIVSTLAGGVGEVVRQEQDGFLLPVDASAEALASACVLLLSDAERRAAFGLNARQRVIDHFSLEKMTAALESIYRDTLAKA